MEKRDFIETVKAELTGLLPKGVELEETTVTKTGDRVLEGLILRKDDEPSPVFYAEDLYEAYCNGEAVDEIVANVMYSYTNAPEVPDADFFENIDQYLSIRLLNRDRNKAYLETVPSIPINEDLCLTLDLRFSSEWIAPVNNDLYEGPGWFTIARSNAPRIAPAIMRPLSSMLFGGYEGNLLDVDSKIDRDTMYVLTNSSGIYGASALFYDGVKERIHELVGNYYVIPSSIHEWIIVPTHSTDSSVQTLRDMVNSANRDIVGAEEVLSDEVYIYDGCLRIA